jgi:hypothetical protein
MRRKQLKLQKLWKRTGTQRWAVKAQIHAGGRGKSGGVKIAKSLEEVETYAAQMIGMKLITPQTLGRRQIGLESINRAEYLLSWRRTYSGILYEHFIKSSARPHHAYVFPIEEGWILRLWP